MVIYTGAGNRTNVRINGENIAPYVRFVYFAQKQINSKSTNRERAAGSGQELPSKRCMTVYVDMEKIHDKYILIDCMPLLGMIMIDAIVAVTTFRFLFKRIICPRKG